MSTTHVSSSTDTNTLPALTGRLHVFVAFDWGDEVDLAAAVRLQPAEKQQLARRPRTPNSIAYHPSPLGYDLADTELTLAELGKVRAVTEATVFDFGAVSVALRINFSLPPESLARLADSLCDPEPLLRAARGVAEKLFGVLKPAIRLPNLSELTEEYFVFEIPPVDGMPSPTALVKNHAAWLASLVRLEVDPLGAEEVQSAIAQRISYSPDDLFLPDWSAALLLDRQCDETLQVIEFANLQLLEFRFVDQLLDDRLSEAYRLIQPLKRRRLPFFKTHNRPLRELGQLKIDANRLFDRAGNGLKLVGDQYLARVYRLLAQRFHLDSWQQSISQTLGVVEDVYGVVSDQATSNRTEVLEIVVIVLILIEVVVALWHH